MKDFEINMDKIYARRQLDVSALIIMFFDISEKYDQITISHLGIFLALLRLWTENRFQNPITVTRSKIMRLARIHARTTYHKCIKDFLNAGLIEYYPSFHPQGESKIVLCFSEKNISSYRLPLTIE